MITINKRHFAEISIGEMLAHNKMMQEEMELTFGSYIEYIADASQSDLLSDFEA